MLTDIEIEALKSQRKYFIEDPTKASYFELLMSKGTNFTCYIEYLNSLSDEQKINNKITTIRTIIYALHRPIQFVFFYWTVLLIILHKFNFKKPIMKIVLWHFILRSSGNVVDKFGDLMSKYYANTVASDNDGIITYKCRYDASTSEMHPLKWVLTRQFGTILWYVGEIFADWYPLLRTRAVARNKQSIWYVYFTCGLFNFSKISLIIYHFMLNPKDLYNEHGVYRGKKVNDFYFTYWIIQLSIIYTSVIYDFSVYYALKRTVFQKTNYAIGFIKNFKTISEYRILISAGISVIFLPIVSLSIIMKYYYHYQYHYDNLDFSFEEIRKSIANVPHYMIFIDQILLLFTRHETSSIVSKSDTYSSKPIHNLSNNQSININNSLFNSKYQYKKLNNNASSIMNGSNNSLNTMDDSNISREDTFINNNQSIIMEPSYSTSEDININVNNSFNINEPLYSPRKRSITNHSGFSNFSSNQWNIYVKKGNNTSFNPLFNPSNAFQADSTKK
ncbi:hypothetical protein H8356DRAFT_977420 [Neocallimastix lanati (nom. inval.)]|jgi:hypothetical protein|nr:hypothetical protein H8356DRAFT_977420 [Neocallimastix sp. JGI-2020a]